ncbi:MAG: pentapeptide repeat-containing protein [Saprospiraceae bacterium]
MKLIIRNMIMLGIISAVFAFSFAPYSVSPKAQLQAITDQIDTELLTIEKKGNLDRVLSKRLIKEIAHFSNSCPLEKKIIDSKGMTTYYSEEKGQLLLTLLNRKLDQSTYKKIFKMVTFQNAFLKDAKLKAINLKGIELSNAYLVGADLDNANLEKGNLNKTNLSKATLRAVNLKSANLQETILNGADLSDAILINAYLVGAKLGNNAKLDRVDFTKANLKEVDFSNTHPSFVKP